jgi:hypothetical protein
MAELLAPGCLPPDAARARARAKARYARITADEDRIGLDALTRAACNLTIFPNTGFTVERCLCG